MPLNSGTTLGPYQIQAPLGAGGMGQIDKATDTHLDRTVAIKVLPEHVAADSDLKQRFERTPTLRMPVAILLPLERRQTKDPLGFRVRCSHACLGSLTARGPVASGDSEPTDVDFCIPRLPSVAMVSRWMTRSWASATETTGFRVMRSAGVSTGTATSRSYATRTAL